MAIFRKQRRMIRTDVEERILIDKMRFSYNLVQRAHPKNNPDFKRMAHDGEYRIKMLHNMPND